MFLVDLEVGYGDLVDDMIIVLFLDILLLKNLLNRPWDYTPFGVVVIHPEAFHGIGFPGSSLPIGDDSRVVSCHHG